MHTFRNGWISVYTKTITKYIQGGYCRTCMTYDKKSRMNSESSGIVLNDIEINNYWEYYCKWCKLITIGKTR